MALQEERKIDIHTHFIPKQFPEMAKKYGGEGWPMLLHRGLCQADIYYAGKHYRQIDDRSWDPERRLKDMDAEGIAVQVLSPIPVTFAYRFSAQAVLELAQLQNDEIANVTSVAPERFIGLGTVPLQAPELAAAEVRRAVTRLGLAGVEIGTQIEGKNLDDPALEPFWRSCVEVGAAVFVHPAARDATREGDRRLRRNFTRGASRDAQWKRIALFKP
jgi:aminocarboxymuconate-semialdehyde decarboxylase